MNIILRTETINDHRIVEEITRVAFWNMFVPGCNEHFLVHQMRTHPDFLPDLDFVAEADGTVVGNIMYTRSSLVGSNGELLETVTFGPLSVRPEFQRKGIGSALIRHTAAIVKAQGYPAIIIFGNPSNYVSAGFVSAAKYHISIQGGMFPSSMLVMPLRTDLLINDHWKFTESSVYSVSNDDAETFDKSFPTMEKIKQPSQELFAILSRSFIQENSSNETNA